MSFKIKARTKCSDAALQVIGDELGKTFKPSESMVRLLAQASLTMDTAAAIEFGEIRVDLFPDSYRAYDFLGDVWSAKGDASKAREYYTKALWRSPDNAAIREKLDELPGR